MSADPAAYSWLAQLLRQAVDARLSIETSESNWEELDYGIRDVSQFTKAIRSFLDGSDSPAPWQMELATWDGRDSASLQELELIESADGHFAVIQNGDPILELPDWDSRTGDRSPHERGDESRDRGYRVLQPVTVEEYGAVEAIIGELYRAYGEGRLSQEHAETLHRLADLLDAVSRDTTPGKTPRWRVIGPLRAVLVRLFQHPFRDALALSKLIEIVRNANWSELAESLNAML